MTDEKIIELYFERSESAIDETEKSYGKYFHYIAYGILCDEDSANEIVNDTYLKAWNTIPPERPYNLRAFLGRITRQLSINRLEHDRAQKRGGKEYFLALEELDECISDPGTADDMTDMAALRDLLNEFLRSSSVEVRRVFIKRYWYMHSIDKIANDLSMSKSKVKSMLMRTRKRLKKYLTDEGVIV